MEGMRKFLALKSTSTAGGSNGLDDVKGDALDFVKEKLSELLHFFQHIWAYLVSKADETFPPDTNWAHIGLVVVLPVALALLCLCCCRRSLCSCLQSLCSCLCSPCRCLGRCLRSLCRCLRRLCCCGRRMMHAPGRDGALMPRDVFESDPREYFINLRAGKELVF